MCSLSIGTGNFRLLFSTLAFIFLGLDGILRALRADNTFLKKGDLYKEECILRCPGTHV